MRTTSSQYVDGVGEIYLYTHHASGSGGEYGRRCNLLHGSRMRPPRRAGQQQCQTQGSRSTGGAHYYHDGTCHGWDSVIVAGPPYCGRTWDGAMDVLSTATAPGGSNRIRGAVASGLVQGLGEHRESGDKARWGDGKEPRSPPPGGSSCRYMTH